MAMRKLPVFLMERKEASVKAVSPMNGWIDWDEWGLGGILQNPSQRTLTPVDMYRGVSYVRRAVNLRANALMALPWEITDSRGEPVWTSTDEPPDSLAAIEDFPLMIRRVEQSLCLTGAAYMLKVTQNGRLAGLSWFAPTTIKPLWNPKIGIYSYERTVRDQKGTPTKILYDPEDIVAIFASDPFTEIGASHPDSTSATVHAQVLNALNGFAERFLESGAVKATLLGVSGNVPPDKKEELENWWKKFVAGWRNLANTKVINSDALTATVIGEGLKELANVDLSMEQRKGIAQAFEIPFSLLDSETSTDANVDGDHQSFLSFTIVPAGKGVQPQWNEQLFADLDLSFAFRPERHEIMQRAEVAKATSLAPLVDRGILTIDEARETLGYEPLDGVAAEEADKQAELKQWGRFLKRYGFNGREFKTRHLENWEASIIRERLADGVDIDEALRLP